MVVAYSSDTINKVEKLLLEGYSYTEISEKIGVSTAKISEVKNKFESELGKIDFETIREFSKIIKKNNISWSDLFCGNIIISYIKKLGIDISTFESFVKNFYNECDKNDLESQKIIQYGEKLFLLEQQSGMSLENLPEECQNLINEKKSLEKEINQLNQDSEKSRNNTKTILDENNQTLEKLNAFIKSKNILEKIGISLEDYSKSATMFQNAKDDNHDLEQIITHLQKETSHEQRISQYQSQENQLESQNKELEKQVKSSREELNANQPYLNIIRRFESDGIKGIHLENLYDVILDISRQHHIGKKESITKFHDDMQNNYYVILGLKTQIKSLNDEMDAKSTRLDSLETKIENLKLKYREEQNIIAIIKSLKQKGIDPFLIFTWNKILEISNLKPKIFKETLQKFTNVNQLITAEQQELDQLTKEKKKLESTIDFLKSNREKLESTIKYGNEIIKKSLIENIQEAVNQIRKTTTMGNNSIKNMQDSAIASIGKISQETFDQMKENFDKTQSLVKAAMESSEKIGQLEFFIPLYKLVNGSFVPTELYPTLVAILDKFSFQIQRQGNGSSSLLYDIKNLREKLIKELNKTG